MFQLVSYDRLPTEPVDAVDFEKDDVELIHRALKETIEGHDAYGLSAPQIGIPKRAFAMKTEAGALVVFNPRVVDQSQDSQELEEGCLSFPGLLLAVERSRLIKVRYSLVNGEVVTKTFPNFTARVFLHECDHLDGLTFIDRQPGLRRQFALKRWAKLRRIAARK